MAAESIHDIIGWLPLEEPNVRREGNEDLLVDGRVEGLVQLAEGMLTVAEKGTVTGTLLHARQ